MATMLEQPVMHVPPDPMQTTPLTIRRVRKETHDTFTLEIERGDGRQMSPSRPGQFNMLYVFGAGEVPISISSTSGGLLHHTTRVVGAVTRAMRQLKRGDTLGVRGPFGTSWPMEEVGNRDVVIVAGGIGLAPLRPVLQHLLATRERARRVVLLYGARTPEDILYRRELESWRSQLDMEVHVTVDRATPGWRGNVGVVTTLIPRAPFEPASTLAMLCGPEVMMRFTVLELFKRGVTAQQIHLSLERNMKCAVGFCGHCQFGPHFICRDGPVFRLDRVATLLGKAEI